MKILTQEFRFVATFFWGDYDERYGPEKDSMARVFAGTGIERLEAAQQRATKSEIPNGFDN